MLQWLYDMLWGRRGAPAAVRVGVAGALAVTGGISSAFASEEIFQSTLRRVEDLLNAGLESTRAYLRPNLDAYRDARQRAEAAQRNALPATLGHANPDLTAFRHAKNDLLAAIAVSAARTPRRTRARWRRGGRSRGRTRHA